MMMQTWLRELMRGVAFALLIIAAQEGKALPGWSSNFKAALAQAQREGRPVVVDFGSATCPACRMLESRTLTNPQVQGHLDEFVRVYVDGNEQVSLRQSFGVQYYPTLVFLSPDGKVLKRHVGYVGPDEMTSVLRQIANSVPKKAESSAVAAKPAGDAKPSAPGTKTPAKVVAKANLYEATDASAPKPQTQASKTRSVVVHTVQTDQRTKIEFVAEGRGGGEEKVVAQALPMPKNVETPAPLVNIKPEGTPAPAASPSPTKSSGLPESVKKLQGVGSSETKAATPTAAPELKPSPTPAPVEQKTSARSKSAEAAGSAAGSTASASRSKAPESAAKSAKASQAAESQKVSARPTASAADIEAWFADAEAKMKAGYKKEARAMYAKIVERDPENKYGKSDLAFIRMVAFSVDRDDDEQRRAAHAKIKEFLKRFPNSPHKDYYTIVRAILATDLGDYAEAHALLDRFPEEFPDSRYRDLARSLWEELPKDAKSLQRRPLSAATPKVPTAKPVSKVGTGSEAAKPAGKQAKSSGSASQKTETQPATTKKKTSSGSGSSKTSVSRTEKSKSQGTKPSSSSSQSKSKSTEKK